MNELLQHALAEYMAACGRLCGLLISGPSPCSACGGKGYIDEARDEDGKTITWNMVCTSCGTSGWSGELLALATLLRECESLGKKTYWAIEQYGMALRDRPKG